MDAFISHSSKDREIAGELERGLEAGGLSVWFDDSDIRIGVLLGKELQGSIRESRVLVLVWSAAAAESRYVNAEWLMALHQDRLILPCALDETPLPQCLAGNVFLNLGTAGEDAVARLTPAIRDSGNAATPLAPLIRSESPELTAAIAQIREAQGEVMAALRADELDKAAELQGKLRGHGAGADPVVARPDDRQLGGYHLKNAYLVEHWDAIQAGRAPKGPLLDRPERRFFETLSICPTDPSALNSLGNILFFERDLDAAEFFHLTAIAAAHERGMASYPEAEQDLALVRRYQLRVPSQPVDPGVDPGVV